jgi:hypothetical protein
MSCFCSAKLRSTRIAASHEESGASGRYGAAFHFATIPSRSRPNELEEVAAAVFDEVG